MFQIKCFSIISVVFIGYGIYLMLHARFGIGYWQWGKWYRWRPMTPGIRAWSRFLTPPSDHLYFQPRTAVDPGKIETALKLGDFYRREGKNEEALEAYHDALSADPSSVELRARIDQLKSK